MSGLVSVMLSLGVLAALLLIGAGIWALMRGRGVTRQRAWLMIAVGLVTLVNVIMWATMPAAPPRP